MKRNVKTDLAYRRAYARFEASGLGARAYLDSLSGGRATYNACLCALRAIGGPELVAGISASPIHPPVVEVLDAVEAQAFMLSLRGPRDAALVGLMLYGGLRISEACNLPRDRVDLVCRKITIKGGKGERDRVVPIVGRLAVLIEDADRAGVWGGIAERRTRDLVCQAAARIGRPDVGPHSLRHTFSTNALRAGVNIRDLQRILGHSSLDTTMRYLAFSDNETVLGKLDS